MDSQDRQAIEGLFHKLDTVGRQGHPRDAEAERFIADRITQLPAAPYYMAQAIVVQEQALTAAQARIEELERQVAQRSNAGGGLFGGLFGGGASQPQRPAPRPQAAPFPPGGGQPGGPWGGQQARGGGGGGFLAGAAQTAVGVAGGMMLGNMLAGMFADPAAAAEQAVDDVGQEAEQWADDAGAEADSFFGDEEF
ncbi:DUF2076 domain-containing protein [Marinivivus vitaminiproducens]|uniref:DUF2076 domain-containing protein n=1 Tax=Marinivivus vitaminiproducens TaxID=3035935 RepID=UPI00279867EA|nr:DUF2076 domain-containing protein [Geminicoccaceae bacterium SCSIO 64248]